MHAIGKLRPVTTPTASRPAASASGRRRRRRRPASVRPGTESVQPARRPPARRGVKYVGCPLERTAPGGAKRAPRGKEFNSGRYYDGSGGRG